VALEGSVGGGGGGGVLGGLSLRICVVGVVGEVHMYVSLCKV